jgi:YVTN family beta-propeller protein
LKNKTLTPILTLGAFGLLLGAASIPAQAVDPGYHLVRKISLEGDGGWDYLTVDSTNRRIYVSRSTHVNVVDADTGKTIGDIPGLNGVHGIAVDDKAGRGFISCGRSNSVTVFDLKTLAKIQEVPVGEGPDAIIFDPATERIFTFNGQGNSFTAIEARTGKVLGTVPVGGRPEFAVADGKGHLYNNLEDKGAVVAIDSRKLTVGQPWPLGAESPSGMAMDVKNHRLFSVCDGDKMVVLNSETGAVVATPAIGGGPDASAYDDKEKLVFSPNGEDGTLTVIREVSPDKYEAVSTVATQAGARTMALDAKTHHVFLMTATQLPADPAAPAGGRRRRAYEPGSFTLLELAP